MQILTPRFIAFTLGFTFVTIALLGFIPNPLVSDHGLFEVNTAHNLTHLLSGLVFLAGPLLFRGKETAVITLMAWVYLPVAVMGFLIDGDMLLGIIHVNQADKYLHVLVAAAFFIASFIARKNAKLR